MKMTKNISWYADYDETNKQNPVIYNNLRGSIMGKKKVEHVVFDGMRKIKKKINISEYNKKHVLKKKANRDKKQNNS